MIEMKLLIDEQLLGCGLLLRSIGFNIVLTTETGLQKDEDLAEYARVDCRNAAEPLRILVE